MKELYSKHKDRDPQGTVDGIVEMLEQAGLDTEMRWTSHPFEGLCSNRVTIAGTNTGTNGKGASEQYCLASGYAEFMKRLQNNILGSWRPRHADGLDDARCAGLRRIRLVDAPHERAFRESRRQLDSMQLMKSGQSVCRKGACALLPGALFTL